MRRRPRRAFWPLLVVLAFSPSLAPRDASAADPPMSAAARRRARALYDEAEKFVDAERWADALAKLEALVAVNKATETPVVIFYTGLCKANLGRLRESLQDYRRARVLLAADSRSPARERALLDEKLGGGIDDLEGRIPRLTLRRPPGGPEGTPKLSIDGAEIDPATSIDKPLPLDPGDHKLRAELASAAKPFEKDFSLAEKQALELSLDFEPVPPPKPPPPKPKPPEPAPTGGAQKFFGYAALGLGGASLVGAGAHVTFDRVLGNNEKNADLVSLALGGGGLLGVGAGIVLLVTAPSPPPAVGAAPRPAAGLAPPAPPPGLRFGGGPSRDGASFWLGGSF
jgi:tetratricopeptide (TPR) repeat protein